MEKESRTFTLYTGRLIPVVILCWIATICAVICIPTFDHIAFLEIMYDSGIVQYSAVQTWGVIFALIGIMGVLWPGVLAVCLTITVTARPGFSILSKILDVTSKAIRILRYVLIGYFFFCLIRYLIHCLSQNLVVYLIISALLFEGVLGVACYFFLQLLIKFFSHCADTLASLQYIRVSGKVEYSSAHIIVNRILFLLGLLGISLAVYFSLYPFVDRFFCLSSLLLTASANIILSALLKSCQTRISYEAYRLAKEKKQAESA